jgi:hypothetical protein
MSYLTYVDTVFVSGNPGCATFGLDTKMENILKSECMNFEEIKLTFAV